MSKSADESERREAQRRLMNRRTTDESFVELLEKERFIHQIAELTPVVINVFDLVTERDTYISSDVFTLLGYTPEEMIQMEDPISPFRHPEDISIARENLARSKESADGEITEFEYRVRRRDGQWRWLRSRSMPFSRDEQGAVRQIVTATLDITERKRAEEALRRAHEEVVQRVVERTEQLSAINEELIMEINEREHAEESLRRSEAYLAEGQKLSHTGSWAWNVSTGDLYWSDGHYRICGLDPEKERPVYPTMQWIHPEDRAFVQETFEQSIRERSGFELDCRIVWTDGTIRYVHSLAHPAFNKAGDLTEYVGTIIDTTERRQAEELLRKANERVEMVLESITDNFFAVDNEWRYTHFNKHAEEQLKALGMNPASLIGQVLWDVFPNATSGEKLRRSMTERAVHIDEQHTPALGEWYENRIYPSPDGGLLIFQRYVTERKRAEEELQRAQSELAHVTRVTTLGELTASIAHEVNQPLGAIATNGYACLRLLSRDAPDLDGAREAAEAMINDAMRASGVIKRIRALLKKAAPEKALLDINEIIREVISLASSELIKNQVALRTELVTGLPQVEGDRVQLQQVVLNLILNGNEAISGADWQPRELLISSEVSKPGEMIVRVRDTGTGLDPQDGERIFEPFFTTKDNGGLGLGLSISRTIIAAHGGRLWATTNEGPGSTFQFTLPASGGN